MGKLNGNDISDRNLYNNTNQNHEEYIQAMNEEESHLIDQPNDEELEL